MPGLNINGIGVDIEQVSRFADKPYAENERFYEKLFTAAEIEYCLSKKNPAPHFTARFCAKEALAKALPAYMRPGWREVSIVHEGNGNPVFVFDISDDSVRDYIGHLKFNLSISHDRTQAVAFVIVQS